MSKTDKDRPDWVRENDNLEPIREEFHTCGRSWRAQRIERECDIDQPSTGSSWWRYKNCGYFLSYHRWSTRNVPKWFVDHTWNNVERVRERDTLREMTKEFNANFGRYGVRGDDADLDFPNFQHRHRSRWYWD